MGDTLRCAFRRCSAVLWLCPPLLAASCVAPPDESEPEVAVATEAVIGGTMAAPCGWPSTVRVNSATSCTGTLIHPRIVTTAAHCIAGTSAEISFGAGRNTPGGFTVTGQCRAGARGSRGVNTANDWAYCVLPEDPRIARIPITPPLARCEAERFLKPGARAWVVGFGITSPSGGGGGAKRQVEVVINQLDKLAAGTIDVGDAQAGACHGDSGGPLYMQLTEGGKHWGFRTIGATSGPGSRFGCDCTCSTTYVNIEKHLAEIEQNEDIDVTPCTDDAGNWAPGPGCNAFVKDPEHGQGSWPDCNVALTTDPIATCGPASSNTAGASGAAGGGSGAGGMSGSGATSGIGAGGAGAGGADAGGAGIGGGGAGGNGASGATASGAGGAGTMAAPMTAGMSGTPGYAPGSSGAGAGVGGSLLPGAATNVPSSLPPAQSPQGCACTLASGTQPSSPLRLAAIALPLLLLLRRRSLRRCRNR